MIPKPHRVIVKSGPLKLGVPHRLTRMLYIPATPKEGHRDLPSFPATLARSLVRSSSIITSRAYLDSILWKLGTDTPFSSFAAMHHCGAGCAGNYGVPVKQFYAELAPLIYGTENLRREAPFECTGQVVRIDLETDRWGIETWWDVKDANGKTVVSGGNDGNGGTPYGNGETHNERLCLAPGKYTVTVHDKYGDGMCCGQGYGNYMVWHEGIRVASGGDFDSNESATFGEIVVIPSPAPTARPSLAPSESQSPSVSPSLAPSTVPSISAAPSPRPSPRPTPRPVVFQISEVNARVCRRDGLWKWTRNRRKSARTCNNWVRKNPRGRCRRRDDNGRLARDVCCRTCRNY
jgi:hypothetical protein